MDDLGKGLYPVTAECHRPDEEVPGTNLELSNNSLSSRGKLQGKNRAGV
jgi:hypothetical protein